jgi:hypothetical protein
MDLYGDYEQKMEELVQREITELKEVCKTPDVQRIKKTILESNNLSRQKKLNKSKK